MFKTIIKTIVVILMICILIWLFFGIKPLTLFKGIIGLDSFILTWIIIFILILFIPLIPNFRIRKK